jgi:hypothetical protein
MTRIRYAGDFRQTFEEYTSFRPMKDLGSFLVFAKRRLYQTSFSSDC